MNRYKNTPTQTKLSMIFGNKCNHSKPFPKSFDPPKNHAKRPSILLQATENLSSYYKNPLKYLRRLSPCRQKRSERREAIKLVLEFCFHYLDLADLQVCIPVDNSSFLSIDIAYISQKLKIGYERVKRAIKDLCDAGYMSARRVIRKDNDTFKSLASIKKINASLFYDLGISSEKLHYMQAWRRKKNEKSSKKQGFLHNLVTQIFRPKQKPIIVASENKITETKEDFYQKKLTSLSHHKKLMLYEEVDRRFKSDSSKNRRQHYYDVLENF